MDKLPELSIFFPFWNEEENIVQVVEKALAVAPTIADNYEVLVIDDGSSDQTLKKAEELSKKYKQVRAISHNINRGYGAALRSGFEHAKFQYIVFTDGDLQFDFAEVDKFVAKIRKADMVIGFRTKRRDKKLFKR